MGMISWLIVGAVAGYVAGLAVAGDERFGLAWHIVLGIIGAAIGGLIAGTVTGIGYVTEFSLTTLVVATIGAVAAVYLWNVATRGSRTGGPVA